MITIINHRNRIWLSLIFILAMNGVAFSQDETPWRTVEGRACIREWMQVTLSRLNSSDLGAGFNERKPWRFNPYGVLLGKQSWTNAAPDLFDRYDNTEHWVWAHYNRNAAGLWTGSYSFFEKSTIPILSCKVYTSDCLMRNAPLSPSLSGARQTGNDYVQKSEKLAGDGVGDWAFPIRLIGRGTIVSVSINSISGEFSVWDTVPGNGMWCTAVNVGGQVRNSSDGSISLPVSGTTDLTLYVSDNGTALANGKTRYQITIRFKDGRTVVIDPTGSTTVQIPSGPKAGASQTDYDYVQKSEKLAGDGVRDWAFPVRLIGQGTIVMVSINSKSGEFSVWDTVPGNGMWCAAVTVGGQVRNSSDGSISLPVNGTTDLVLYVADSGTALANGKTRYQITIQFKNGRTVTIDPVRSATAQIPD
jgi:hypothetical protein